MFVAPEGRLAHVHGIAVRSWGEGPPLLLLHGGMGSWTHWIRNIGALATCFTVHALDLPGCGDSLTVPRDIAEDDYVDLVVSAVSEVGGPAPFNLAGFSFGGITAALVAARMGDRLSRLALLGPGGFGQAARLDLRAIPSDEQGESALRDVLRHNLAVMMCENPASITEETVDIQQGNFRKGRFDGRRFSVSGRMPDCLERISCPVQGVWGGRDALPRAGVQERIDICLRMRPDMRVHLEPQAGHWVQYEAASGVNKVLLDFFS